MSLMIRTLGWSVLPLCRESARRTNARKLRLVGMNVSCFACLIKARTNSAFALKQAIHTRFTRHPSDRSGAASDTGAGGVGKIEARSNRYGSKTSITSWEALGSGEAAGIESNPRIRLLSHRLLGWHCTVLQGRPMIGKFDERPVSVTQPPLRWGRIAPEC